MRYSNLPYKPRTMVDEIELKENIIFVRVYDGEVSGMYGGWVMKAADIKGLTSEQIQDKFVLLVIPKYIVDINLEQETHLRTGIVNLLEGL